MLSELSFLGSSEVRLNGRAVNLPTRKAFALLAFIACEPGLHSREKLAAMFWPDNDETGGRTALRKALGFLNTALGVEGQTSFLKVTRDALGFDHGPNVQSDVLDLETAAKRARTIDDADASELRTRLEQVVDGLRGEFMAGFTLPESTDFEDWLDLRRESLRRDADAVLHRLSSLQANAGQVQVALVTARKRVALDALNEGSHRAVIELHLHLGDRAAALEAYRSCQGMLEKELGIAPAAETQALAEQARSGERPSKPAPGAILTVIAPKPGAKTVTSNAPFVGREREWAMLEDAWNTGLIAFVSGEPGSGKSRLMQEFMRNHGEHVTLENRPGDAGVPYASLARHLRALFKTQPVTLEAWASTELSRILPELGGEPSPIQSEQGKLRFLQAIAHAFQNAIQTRDGITALVYDDAQFTDTSSSEATNFVLEQLEAEDRERLRILYGYRKNELSVELEARVKHSLVTGEGALIELEPLDENALVGLLESSGTSFETNELIGIAETLRRFTGGNPLFMLETMKALSETQHDGRWTNQSLEALQSSGGLPRTLKVKQVIERRLERLSKPAKDLVRVAAVMGQEYTLERAAKVLEADSLVLAEASEELEVVGIVRANRFTHDLLFEASYEGVPNTAKRLLHSRILELLENSSSPAAALLKHAFGSEQVTSIARYSFQAARQAKKMWALPEAIAHLERLRQFYLETMQNINTQRAFSADDISKLYRFLRTCYVWSFNYSQARVVEDEHLNLIRSRAVLEDECAVLASFQYYGVGNVYTATERLAFAERALELAYDSGRTDLISISELILSSIFSLINAPSNNEKNPKRLFLAVSHAKKALKYAKICVEADQAIHSLIEDLQTARYLFIWSHSNLALRFLDINLFEDAEFHQEQALILNNNLNNPRYLASYTLSLAETKIRLGKLAESDRFCIEAMHFMHEIIPIAQYEIYIPLLSVYAQRGEYSQVQTMIQVLKIKSHGNHTKRLFHKYQGLIFMAFGLVSDAQQALLEGLVLEQQMLNSDCDFFFEPALCAVSMLQRDWSQALDYAHKGMSVRDYRSLPFPESCDNWYFETITLIHAGDLNTARADIQAREPHVTKWPRYLLPHLRSVAVLNRFENHLDTALEKLQQALEIAQTIGLPRETWEITSDIARLLERQGHTERASEARARAVAVRDSLVVNVPEDMRARYLEFTDGQIHATLFLGEQ